MCGFACAGGAGALIAVVQHVPFACTHSQQVCAHAWVVAGVFFIGAVTVYEGVAGSPQEPEVAAHQICHQGQNRQRKEGEKVCVCVCVSYSHINTRIHTYLALLHQQILLEAHALLSKLPSLVDIPLDEDEKVRVLAHFSI